EQAVAGLAEGGAGADAIDAVLRDVMIRRTRPILAERGVRLPGGAGFPARAPVVPLRYALVRRGEPDPIAQLERIDFAAVHGRRGAAELLKLVLLKRLESSVAALAATLDSLIRYHEALVAALEDGRLLSAAEHRALAGAAGQLLLAPLV